MLKLFGISKAELFLYCYGGKLPFHKAVVAEFIKNYRTWLLLLQEEDSTTFWENLVCKSIRTQSKVPRELYSTLGFYLLYD